MQKAKETSADVAASAKSGMDKTKAALQEKVSCFTLFSMKSLILVQNDFVKTNDFTNSTQDC